MNIIGVETATSVCSVALLADNDIQFQASLTGEQVHIERLATMLQQAMQTAADNAVDIDALALSIGPGSFTGLRIGLATVKALGSVKKLPLIAIPTLDALAYQFYQSPYFSDESDQVVGLLFSHRNFVHSATFKADSENKTLGEYQYGTLDQLFDTIRDLPLFGPEHPKLNGWLVEHGLTSHFHLMSPDAAAVARLADQRWEERIEDYGMIEPFYNTVYQAKKWQRPTFDQKSGNSSQ